MKRAILVTTSTVVGVAAVLGYKPNSDTAKTLLDITGANNTASTTQNTATETPAPTSVAPAPSASSTTSAAASPKPSAAATSSAKPTPKPTQSSAATTKPQATSSPTASATQAPAPAPTATPTAASGATKTLTGVAASAISHGRDYGTVTVTVTLVDGKMTKISATQNPEGRNYPYIQAVRQYLIPAVLKAQQVDVGYVQGATGSSEAFVASLQSALNKA